MPAFRDALNRLPGRATPLAHGLELTTNTIRRTLYHGRSSIRSVDLIVLTDGRGNIPLRASGTRRMSLPVTREGIDDSLSIAATIRQMDRVETILIAPDVDPGRDAENLAIALGAEIIKIPRRNDTGESIDG